MHSPFRRAIGAVAVLTAGAAAAVFVHVVIQGGTAPNVVFQGDVCLGSPNTNCVAATTSPDWVKFDSNAGTGVAQLHVDTTGGTCTRHGVAAGYVDAEACGSLASAFAGCQSGDTISVETGTYPSAQALAFNAGLTNYCTFVVDGGGKFIYRGGIDVYYQARQPNHIYFNGGHTLAFTWRSVANLTVNGMEGGPNCCSSDGFHGGYATGPQNVNLVFTNDTIHGITRLCADYPGQSSDGVGPATCPGDTAVHVDCVQFDTANGLTWDYNTCRDNDEQGLFFGGVANAPGVSVFPPGTSCPTPAADTLGAIVFGCYEGAIDITGDVLAPSIEVGNNPFILGRGSPVTPGVCSPAGNSTNPEFGPSTTITVGYNSTPGAVSLIRSCSLPASVTYTGNVSAYGAVGCTSQVKSGGTETYSHNFFTGKTCGATDTLLSSFTTSFADLTPAGFDAHLLAGAPELLGGDTSNCPSVDIDGLARVAAVCDAGADQVSSSSGSGGAGLDVSNGGMSALTSITSGGISRYFKTYKPTGLTCPSTGCPLVIMLGGSVSNGVGSGCGGLSTYVLMANCDIGTSPTACTAVSGANTACQMFASNWPAQANSQGLILAEAELAPNTCVSGGGCGGPESSPNKQFLIDLIAYIESKANVNTSKIYLYGFSAGASQVMAIANGENGAAGAKFVFTTDWSGLASQFAGFAIQAGALGGDASSPVNQIAVNTPVFTATAKPVIYVTSKDDPTIQADDSDTTHTTFACAVQTSGTCQLKASAVNAYYSSHWGCTGPAKTTVSGGAFLSYDKWDFTCTAPAAYEWVSSGSDATHGPAHTFASYNSEFDVPTLVYAWLAAHS